MASVRYAPVMHPGQESLRSQFLDLFLELCALPSPSGSERAVADRVASYLSELVLEWDEDDAATRLEGDTGNIYCRIPPTNGENGTPIFLCAHTDTLPPQAAIDIATASAAITAKKLQRLCCIFRPPP